MKRGAMVGREAELEVLLESVASGGEMVLVVGEPGIGKSRLVEELARRVEPRRVVWGRAWEVGGAPPFWPWTQVLRALGGDASSTFIARLRGGAEVEVEVEVAMAATSPVTDRFVVFEAVARHLRAAASRECELVILLEDLHAADEASLHLLAFLTGQLRGSHITIVGTYRDVEARLTPASGALLDRIARDARVVHPARLSQLDVAQLAQVSQVSQGSQASQIAPDVVAEVYRRSEGNPLFVVELLRVVAEHGRAITPTSVRTAIREHLAVLPLALRPTLEVAAVIGREVQASVIAGVAKRSAAEIGDELALAVELGALRDRGGGRFAFAHGLIAETLHDDLSAQRRSALHLAVADWLERDPSPPLTEIAHHLLDAGVDHAERACEAAVRAAERGRRQLAYEPAAALIERALDAIASAASAASAAGAARASHNLVRYELMRLLAEVKLLAGDDARGKDLAREAAALARVLGSAERLARAALTYGLGYSFGVTDQILVQLIEEALAGLPTGDSPLCARLNARLAAALTPTQLTAVPLRIARDAIAMARRVGDERTRLDVLFAASSALIPFAHPAERRTIDLEVLALADKLDEPLVALRSHLRLVFDSIELGDLAMFDVHHRAYDDLTETLRIPRARWQSAMVRALRAQLVGDVAAHTRAIQDARLLADGDALFERATLVGHTLVTCRVSGDDARLARDFAAFAVFANVPNQTTYPELGAMLHVRLGDIDAARTRLAGIDLARKVLDHQIPLIIVWAVEIAVAFGERDTIAELYEMVRHEQPPMPCLNVHGFTCDRPMAHAAMLLASALGDHEAARRHYDNALALVTTLGAKPAEAWLYLDRARDVAHLGDAEASRVLVDKAKGIADALGLPLGARIAAIQGAQAAASVASVASVASIASVTSGASGVSGVVPPRAVQLACEGDSWLVTGPGGSCRVKASRGLDMLAKLVADAGRELHVLDLEGAELVDAGDAGEVLDAAAKRAYRDRMSELRDQLAKAESWNDSERADRARSEIEALEQELARATGLGGRDRRAGKAAERARINVQRRITDAIKRIGEASSALGDHFTSAVRTGTYCSYSPDRAPRS